MSEEISKEIEKLLSDQLPESQGKILHNVVVPLYAAESALNELQDVRYDLIEASIEMEGEITDLNALSESSERISKREDAVAAKEAELKHKEEILKLQGAHSDQRVNDHKDMVALVFKSPVYKETITKGGNAAVPVDGGGNGVCGHVVSHPVSSTTEKTIETE
jgi:hypothetical protein